MLQVVLFYQYGPDWAKVIDKIPEHALPGERIWARVMEFEDGKPHHRLIRDPEPLDQFQLSIQEVRALLEKYST